MSTDLVPVPVAVAEPDGITALRHAIARADQQREALHEAGNLDALAAGLHHLIPLLRDLRILHQSVMDDVANLMPSPQWDVEGVGRLERKQATDRRSWDWEALWPALVRNELDPDGTGELPAVAEVVEAMTRLAVDVIGLTGSKAPRVTELRKRGLQVDEWCESKPGKVSVVITDGAA